MVYLCNCFDYNFKKIDSDHHPITIFLLGGLKSHNLINITKQTNPLRLRLNVVDESEHVFSVTKLPLLTAAAYLSVNPAAKLIHLFYLLPSQMIYVAF